MKKKSNILKGFLATASLCGSLLSSFSTEAATVLNTGSVVLSTGAGLASVLNNGDTIGIAVGGLGVNITADKPGAVIGGINTVLNALAFGGVLVKNDVSIGALNAALNLNPNFGPLKFIADNATTIITGVGNQTFTTMDFAGKNSILQINDGLTIKTTIDNNSATLGGTLNLGNGVSITKDIGGSNSLSAVNIKGSGDINFGGIVKAGTVTIANATANVTATGLVTGALKYTAAGSFTANAGLAGSIDFQNNAGTFTLADNTTINGNINSTVNGVGVVNGTLNATSGTVAGAINNLKLLQCGVGNGQTLTLGGNATINSLIFTNSAAASGTINAAAGVTLGSLTFNNGNTAGGTLTIGAASTINGPILNGAKAIINVNANLTINDPNAGSVNTVYIADNTIYKIDAKNGNVDLLNNGAKIVFLGKNSELDLVNTGTTDKQFTLYANLTPSITQNNYGIVRVSASTNGLTIANNGNTNIYTIGRDSAYRLQDFIVDGSGSITIDAKVFTSTLTVNGTGKATFSQPLNLGPSGQIIYKANGTLVVNGVTGSIITNAPDQGILTINNGDIIGSIGDINNSLNLVNIGANSVTFTNNVYAPVKFTADNVAANIAGNGDQTITSIDFAGKNSIIRINDGTNLLGSIDNTGAANNGTLNIVGAATISQNVGNTNPLLAVNINGSGNINFGGIVNSNNITVTNINANPVAKDLVTVTGALIYGTSGSFTAQAGLVGDINFQNNAGKFTLGDGKTISGNINNGQYATLNAASGIITKTINGLNILQCGAGNGQTLNLQSDATINSLVFANAGASGTVNAGGKLILNNGLTFNSGNVAGGILVINAASTISEAITAGDKGTIQIKTGGSLTINHPTAGSVNEVDIADGTTYTIDSANGNVDLLNNGAKIVFLGSTSKLALINSSSTNNSTFKLFANLNALNAQGNAQDNYGIVRVATNVKDLTIDNNGNNVFTIGKDVGNRLKEFIVDNEGNPTNSGNITIKNTVFTKLLSMNSLGKATFEQVLDLGDGNIVFGANGEIVVSGVTGSIITSRNGQGTLTIVSSNITGAVGDATNSLLALNINGNGNITFSDIVKANTITINSAAANVTVAGLITGTINYQAAATMFAKSGINGNVNFNANGGNFSTYSNAGKTLAANFDNLAAGANGTVTISHMGDDAGTAAIINSTIGGTNPIANFNLINGNQFSTNIVLNGAINATNILFRRDVEENPNFTVAINNNITGAIQNVSNGTNNFVLNIANGKKITGTIDSQAVSSTIINFLGSGEVTGAITNATTIKFKGAGNVVLGSTANSTNFVVGNAEANVTATELMTGDLEYDAAGSVTATGGLTGDINFKDQAGKFTLGANSTFEGTVTNAGNGTVIALGNGTITKAINNLNTLQFKGDNTQTLDLKSGVMVNSVVFVNNTGSGTINAGAGLTTNNGITFNGGNASGGTLIVGGISTINGVITNGANGTIQIKADGSLTISDSSATTVKEVDIADGATYKLDAKGSNVNLFQNGEKIVFQGKDSELDLINSLVNAGSFTLYSNLIPSSTIDGYGVIGIDAVAGSTLTIQGNAATTIGQAANRIQSLKLTGGDNSNIIIDKTITIYTQLVSMSSTGQVTFNNLLSSNVVFESNGTLIANNGITGSVTTTAPNQGILTINGGSVGSIGDDENRLGLVNIGGSAVTFSDNVFAPVLLTNQNSALTLGNGVTVTGSVKTSNDNEGILTLGANSSVTGGIGENGASLAQVKVGAGASSLGGNVYSQAVTLTDNTSVLTLLDEVNFEGSITNEADNGSGKLIFEKDGTVGGNVGADGAALAEIEFNGENTIGGTANATNFTVANAATNVVITRAAVGDVIYDEAGTLTIGTSLKGDVKYQGNAGTLVLKDNATLTGTVSSDDGINSVLQVEGKGTIDGVINNLGTLQFNGDKDAILDLKGISTINSVVFGNNIKPSGTINVNEGGGLTAGTITFNDGVGANNNTGGTVVINAPSTVGVIVNPNNGKLVLNADFTTSDTKAGDVSEIVIKNGKTYTIDAVKADNGINLLQDENKIIFEGLNSQLALVNSSNANDRTFTLFNNLNPSDNAPEGQEDGYGIVRVSTAGEDLTITNNGGPFTIGKDADHRLQNFVVSTIGTPENPGTITIDNIVYTKLLSMNSSGKVIFTEALNSNIVFNANGDLTVNGVTGNVTTSKDGQGILTIASGGVSGTIGAEGKSLGLVNVGGEATFSQNVFAPVLLTDQNSALTLGDGVKVTGSVKTKNDGEGILTLGKNSSVTDGIGEQEAALEQVKVGAGDSSLGGNIYAGAVTLTSNTSVLKLLNGVDFGGSITNGADNGKGKLIFEGDGKITENVGAEGAALAEIEFNGENTIGGKANATTLTVNATADANIAGTTIASVVYAGAGKLSTGDLEGGIDFHGEGGTFTLGNKKTLTESAISTVKTSGTFIFAGDGTVTENLGIDGAALSEVIFNGIDTVQSVNATTLTVNAGANATIAQNTTGNAVYAGVGALKSTGDFNGGINFEGEAGTFTLGAGSTIDGAVTSNGGVAGTLIFEGAGKVTEAIGTDAENAPALISVQGGNGTTVALNDDVFVGGIEFTNGGTLDINSSLTTPNIDFGENGGVLELKGDNSNDESYPLNSIIEKGQNGTLNVLTTLIAANPTIGTIKTINIGEDAAPQALIFKVNNANLTLLSSANSSINFLDKDSTLAISNPVEQTVVFANSLEGLAGGGGIVFLDGRTAKLTVAGQNNATLGVDGNELAELNIMGNVTITDTLDVHNIGQLNIKAGANFTDQSLTSAQIAAITIGEEEGAATYGLDAEGNNFDLNTAKMTFANADSALNLENSSAANDSTITLTGPLNPSDKNNNFGKLQLTAGDKDLIISDGDNKDFTLGIADHQLKEIDFVSNGDGIIKLKAGIFVEKIMLGVNAIELGKVTADVYFTKGTVYSATGDINGKVDFQNKAGVINLANGVNINGLITSTGGVAGTLKFEGAGSVTGAIGTDAENAPALISVQGGNRTTVALNDDVFVGGIKFTNGGTLDINSSLTTPNIDFGENGGVLEFKGANPYNLGATIANGGTGTINLFSNLTATSSTVGKIGTVNVGSANTPQTYTIQVDNANLALDSNINLLNAASELTIIAPQDQTVTLGGNIEGAAGNGGIVNLDGNGNNLIINGNGTFGANGSNPATLNISSNVTIADTLDVHNIGQLNIKAGANFTDQSLTSAQIAAITIGEEEGAATYGLDAEGNNFDLNTAKMTFANADSALNLENSSAANDSTITLTGALNPGNDKFGKLQLTAGDKDLIISDGGNKDFTLGIADHQLKEIDFVSNGDGIIKLKAGIFVEKIMLGVNAIELGKVTADVYFTKGTAYSATGDINGNVDFQNKAGVINLANGVNINGLVTSTDGENGTLNFEGDGEVTDLITNIAILKAGAGNVSLSKGGNYSIVEIQGNGNNSLTFAANSNLTGGINTTGGEALNLIFTNGGSVSDAVGSNAAVGDITVQAGTVNFGDTVKSGHVIILKDATVQVSKDVTATDISGDDDNSGTLKLNNPAAINITGTIGANKSLNTIEVANSDAKITGAVNTQNINFSKNQAATLTLEGATNVTNVTTAGNNIHTIAVTNFDTGNGNIGTADNRLKAIELTGNGLVTINTNNFYSGVSTANNNQGKVKFNTDGAIGYDLGSSDKSLATVQFSGNSTVKGDVYSRDITLDAGKTAIFERGDNNLNPKTPIVVPKVKVDQDMLPRSLEMFTYLTDVKAQTFNFADATSSAEFKDAVVLDAPINNGATIKFDKNVWLKQEITNAKNVQFSPGSFALLEKNIKVAKLIADQSTLVLLDKIVVDANLEVRDAVLDLGTYELKHTGNVTHNGSLTLITYYDTTLKTGGHVLVGNGASVDMSGVDNVIVKIKSRSDLTKINNGDRHQVVQLEAGATFTPAPQNKVSIDDSGEDNRFVSWVSDNTGLALVADDGTGTGGGGGGGNDDGGGGTGGGGTGGGGSGGGGSIGIKPVFNPNPIKEITKGNPVAGGIADQLTKYVTGFGNNSDAGKLLSDLGLMKDPNRVNEALDRLGERINTNEPTENIIDFNASALGDILSSVAIDIDNLTSSGIEGRLDDLGSERALSGLNEPTSTLNNNPNRRRRANPNQPQAAVAAGDEDTIGTGIWGVPFYGNATQKSKNGVSGYKSNTAGGIIGFDYAFDNSVVVGAAYTRADTKLRNKNDKIGDRTKAVSDIFSVYGLYNWPQNNYFIEGIASYGRTGIKNKEKRLTSTGDQIAIGKFTNTSYSGELLGGYNYILSHLTTLTPMLGVRYSIFKNDSYKEKGTTFQNLSVRKNSYNKFEGIFGLKGVTNFLVQDIMLRPELHGFINYDPKAKLPNTDAYLDGINEPLTTIKFKPAKVIYNVGCGVSTKYNMLELGIKYNLYMAKKYMANQGSIKVKVNL